MRCLLILAAIAVNVMQERFEPDVDIKKSNLYDTRGITPKRVTSGGVHLHSLAHGQLSSEETSQRWLAVGDTASDLTIQGIEPRPSTRSRCL